MKSPGLLTALTLALGLSISSFVWRSTLAAEDRSIRSRFQAEAEGWRSGVADQMDHFMAVLDSIRHLHDLSSRISAADLAEFVAKGMRYQQDILGVFGFAQQVPRESRASFESVPLGDEKGSSVIVEPAEDGSLVVAGDRAEYFPILYVAPSGGLGLPAGYDLGADAANGAAVERMRTTGTTSLGAVMEGTVGTQARLVFSPILVPLYDDAQKAFAVYLRGFAFALLRPDEILKQSLPREAAASVSVTLSPEPQPPASGNRIGGNGLASDPVFSGIVYVANEAWPFICKSRPGYLASRRSQRPAILFASGLVITLLLSFQVYMLSSRAREVEKLVRVRTAELRDEIAERRRLQAEMLNISSREQDRIGRDLHDSLGQKLAGAVFLSRAVTQGLSENEQELRANALKLNEILKESVAQVRLIARGLSPVDVGEDGLPNALRRLADETTGIFSVACSFKNDSVTPSPMDGKRAGQLYQIAQEAVTNAFRHGRARSITIRLAADQLLVEDDGQGFDASSASTGMGLRIMKYRAELIGGSLDILSKPGNTTLVCRFGPTDSTDVHG